MFDEIAAALQFPTYFGGNWAAFEECLSDLEWLPAAGYVLVIGEAELVLAEEPGEFLIFVRTLERIGAAWREPISQGESWDRPSKPFHSIFVTAASEVPVLRRRMVAAGVQFSFLDGAE